MMHRPLRLFAAGFAAALTLALPAQEHKDLGRMWTFENVPVGWLQSAYDFTPDKAWLDHARAASLRFGRGCSASFVSPHGLIMTNHHCARDMVAGVQGENDWVKDGFYAGDFTREVKLPGLTVQQLVKTTDITKRVGDGENAADIQAEFATAEPGLTHQVITLYQGGMYQIYSYKIYDDIRLVCAPHGQVAHFGGDPDNFCYPRWGLDFTFCRAYVNDNPADTREHYFGWKTQGAANGELVFVTGNPGSTGRLQTQAQCEFLRSTSFPQRLTGLKRDLERMYAEAKESPAKEKDLRTKILGAENSRKAIQGYLDGLENPRIMAIKKAAEEKVRGKVDANAELKAKYGDAWDKVAEIARAKTELIQSDKPTATKQTEMQALLAQERAESKRIGEAFFAVYGTSIPPDATFSLRLSDGVVKGYECNGTLAPHFTSLYGLYARHTEFDGKYPFNLPQVWLDKKAELDLTTPFNLVATCDIIGGNSGSPMIDKDRNVVGLVFDGNIEMLGNNYVFDDQIARTVCVHPAIIIESLRKIYGAGKLADELEQPRK